MSCTSVVSFILISLITVSQANNLQMCEIEGDPHILTFNTTNRTFSNWKHCLNNHHLTILDNAYMYIRAQVTSQHVIDQIDIEFFNQSIFNPICSISSNSFSMSYLGNCSNEEIAVKDESNKNVYYLIITDRRTQTVISLTHYRSNPTRHYNLVIWMPPSLASTDQGVCRVPGCPGSSGPGKRSVQNPNNSTLSNQTIGHVCDTYIDAYLDAAARPASQRNTAYNESIQSARELCRFDGATVGIDLATSYIEGLMIEELTSGIDNMTLLSEALLDNIDRAITQWESIVNQTSIVVAQILDEAFSNRTTTTTSTTTVTTTATTTTTTITSATSVSTIPITTTTSNTSISTTLMARGRNSTIDSSSSTKTYSLLIIALLMFTLHEFLNPIGFFSTQ